MFRRYAIVLGVRVRCLLPVLVLVVIGALIPKTVLAAFNISGNVIPTTDPSTWTSSTYVNIGDTSYGSLKVDGDSDLNSFSARIGNVLGSTGVITVSGAGSTWTESGLLQIGYYGSGTLSIADGGAVNNSDSADLAEYGDGSTGMVTVDGTNSTWTCNATLFVGHRGKGTLNITNGGTVSVVSSACYLGNSSNSRGTATVDGAGSNWSSSQLFVGNLGTGMLRISHGGTVNNTYDGAIGEGGNGTGTVIVDGAGSNWTAGQLTVGVAGAATLNIVGGGTVITTGYTSINGQSLLAIDVGNGSLFKVNNGIGTIANNGTVRILAGAGAAATTYSPISATSGNHGGIWQAVGGIWDSSSNQITVSAPTNGSSGKKIAGINLAATQRALVSDSGGWSVGASFLASSSTMAFTATAISNHNCHSSWQTSLVASKEAFRALGRP